MTNGTISKQWREGLKSNTVKEDCMRTFKRVFAVVLLIVAVLAVGYLCYTGSRLAATHENTEAAYEQTI